MPKLTVDASQPLRWPNRCARCGSKENLQAVPVSGWEIVNTRLQLSGSVRVDTQKLTLHHPMCAQHARGVDIANGLTRNTLGLRLLRFFLWLYGPISGLGLLLGLTGTLLGRTSNLPPAMLGLNVVAFLCFLALLWAYRASAVRVSKVRGEDVTLWFSQASYAAAFKRGNADAVL